MNALRYLVAFPVRPAREGYGRLLAVEAPERVRAKAPALWCSDPSQLHWTRDRQLVVVGSLFDRSRSRPAGIMAAAGAAGLPSRAGSLVEDHWGSYLAVGASGFECAALRDPTGLMPCYVARSGDHILLASDVRTLTAAGPVAAAVDWDRLSEYLQAPGMRRRATCLANIDELSPGVLTSFRNGQRLDKRLWTPWPFTVPERRIAGSEAAEAVRDAVCTSIEAMGNGLHNIVVAMSGGLDSSIVCAALAAAGKRFSALTMYTADPSGDERRYARLAAEWTGAPLTEHRYSIERIDLSQSSSRHLPRPVGRAFMQEIENAFREDVGTHGFDAIFTGNGGDNIFCYLHSAAPIVDRLRSAGDRGGVAGTFVDMCRITQCDMATMARATLSLLVKRRYFGATADRSLLDRSREGAIPGEMLTPYLNEVSRLPGKRSHIEMLVRIQNHVEGYDRRALPASVPVLLAQPIVETCLRIASWDWCRGGVDRAIAREAFSSQLPPAIIARRSKSGPESLTAEIFELGRRPLREMLLGGALRDKRIIDAAAVEAAIDDPAATRGQRLFRLLELAEAEAWARSWSSGA